MYRYPALHSSHLPAQLSQEFDASRQKSRSQKRTRHDVHQFFNSCLVLPNIRQKWFILSERNQPAFGGTTPWIAPGSTTCQSPRRWASPQLRVVVLSKAATRVMSWLGVTWGAKWLPSKPQGAMSDGSKERLLPKGYPSYPTGPGCLLTWPQIHNAFASLDMFRP